MTNYNLDHLVYGAPDLRAATNDLEARTGAQIVKGGRHQLWGTHNTLAGLGPDVYFEVLAPDPTLKQTARSKRIAALGTPQPYMWAVRTSSGEETAATLREAGFEVNHFDMSRQTPDGRLLRWQIVRLESLPLDNFYPFFIDWLDTPHPTTSLPQEMTLAELRVELQDPSPLQRLAQRLSYDIPVSAGANNRLHFTLNTPRGSIKL